MTSEQREGYQISRQAGFSFIQAGFVLQEDAGVSSVSPGCQSAVQLLENNQ